MGVATYWKVPFDGLDEATIYHLGVAPAHRGAGIGRLLLRRATRILVSHGIWQLCAYARIPVVELAGAEVRPARLPPG
jgi:ribosomal protein S18 acetylase RimI-like enzyme